MLAAAGLKFLAEAMVGLMPESATLSTNGQLSTLREKDKAFMTSGRMIFSLSGSGQHESLPASMCFLPLLYFMTKL